MKTKFLIALFGLMTAFALLTPAKANAQGSFGIGVGGPYVASPYVPAYSCDPYSPYYSAYYCGSYCAPPDSPWSQS